MNKIFLFHTNRRCILTAALQIHKFLAVKSTTFNPYLPYSQVLEKYNFHRIKTVLKREVLMLFLKLSTPWLRQLKALLKWTLHKCSSHGFSFWNSALLKRRTQKENTQNFTISLLHKLSKVCWFYDCLSTTGPYFHIEYEAWMQSTINWLKHKTTCTVIIK